MSPNQKSPTLHSIILIGFMGTGKTEVGRLLANRLSLDFVDLDDLIAERAGLSVPAIFDTSGEPRFRALETEAIRSLATRSPFVLATGGGAMLNPENADLLRLYGMVVLLRASPAVILQRVAQGERRPMLEDAPDPLARVKQLLNERKPAYSLADYSLDTSRISPEAAANSIEALHRQWLSEDVVDLPLQRDPYLIHIKDGIIRQAGQRLRSLGLRGRLLIVTDHNVVGGANHPEQGRRVASHYASLVTRSLEAAGFETLLHSVPPGERSKSRSQLWSLLDIMADFKMTRDSTVLALGGGVVGDLAGLAAALYMRGVNLVQVPTSLLAQVDSSVGGKVAVDHPRAKNLIGAFYQPRLVLIDPLCLRTLPRRELRCGLAEVVKYAAIADETLFSHLETNAEKLLRLDSALLRQIIKQCCQIKAQVVLEDERETLGRREVLNFGHTFAHAVEAALNYSGIKHGEAVSLGMIAASRLSAELGLVSDDVPPRLSALLSRLGLPIVLPQCPPQACLDSLAHDKKARAEATRFVLLDGALGKTTIVANPPAEAVTRAVGSICGS